MLIRKDNDNIYKFKKKKIIIWIYTLLQDTEHKIEPTMKPLPRHVWDQHNSTLDVTITNCCYFHFLFIIYHSNIA